eukprot:1157750-Pelagomonas_calceolata.AAC.12
MHARTHARAGKLTSKMHVDTQGVSLQTKSAQGLPLCLMAGTLRWLPSAIATSHFQEPTQSSPRLQGKGCNKGISDSGCTHKVVLLEQNGEFGHVDMLARSLLGPALAAVLEWTAFDATLCTYTHQESAVQQSKYGKGASLIYPWMRACATIYPSIQPYHPLYHPPNHPPYPPHQSNVINNAHVFAAVVRALPNCGLQPAGEHPGIHAGFWVDTRLSILGLIADDCRCCGQNIVVVRLRWQSWLCCIATGAQNQGSQWCAHVQNNAMHSIAAPRCMPEHRAKTSCPTFGPTAQCTLDRVTAVMAYVSDSSVYTAVTENWPNIESTLDSAIQGQQGTDYGAISNIEAISGVFTFTCYYDMRACCSQLNRWDFHVKLSPHVKALYLALHAAHGMPN